MHIHPFAGSTPLSTHLQPSLIGSLAGVQSAFVSPGTSASAQDADTGALLLTHFLTDALALQAVAGLPPEVAVRAQGTVAPTGLLGHFIHTDLGAAPNNPLATARQWSPGLVLQYYFRRADQPLRPFLGIGVSYTWYSDVRLDQNFQKQVNAQFGRLLSFATGNPGPTHMAANASRSWNPLFVGGLSYDFTPHLGATLGASYAVLQTTATIDLLAQDGTLLSTSKTRLTENSLVTLLLLDYRFRLGQ